MNTSLRALTTLALVASLAACGGDDGSATSAAPSTAADAPSATGAPPPTTDRAPATTPATSEPATPATTAAGESAEGATRIVADAFGEVEVPADPQRIVAVEEISTGNALALGLPLVGGFWYTQDLADHLAVKAGPDLQNVFDGDGIDFEAIVALHPDLIIGNADDTGDTNCDLLRAIAPTVCYPFAGFLTKAEGFENLRLVAEATNSEAGAAQLIADYEQRIADLESTVTGWSGKQVGIAYFNGDSANVNVIVGGAPAFLLDDLGIAHPARTQTDGALGWSEQISMESIDVLDDSYALIAFNAGVEAIRTDVESHPIWQSLDVVRNGRVAWVSGPAWYGQDILSLNQILTDIETTLLPLAA